MNADKILERIRTKYQSGKTKTALAFARMLEEELEKQPVSPEYAMCLFLHGRILVDLDSLDEAAPKLLSCQEIFIERSITDNQVYSMAGLALGDLYFKSQQNELAWKFFEEVEQSESLGTDIGVKTKIYHKYAVLSERARKYEEAIHWYEAYLEAFSDLHSKAAPNYLEFYRYKEKLKLALRAKKANYEGSMMSSPFMIYGAFPEGDGAMMDIQYAQYLVSELPDPKNIDLKEVLNQTKKILVSGKGKLEITNSDAIIGLGKLLEVEEQDQGHKMKQGTVKFEFMDSTDQMIAQLEYLGKHCIRWAARWKPDAKLIDGKALEFWLDIKKIL